MDMILALLLQLQKGIKVEFEEKVQVCPVMSYGAKQFCLKNTEAACHYVCKQRPECCDSFETWENG